MDGKMCPWPFGSWLNVHGHAWDNVVRLLIMPAALGAEAVVVDGVPCFEDVSGATGGQTVMTAPLM